MTEPITAPEPALPSALATPAWKVHGALFLCSLIYSAFYAVIKQLLTEVDEWTFIYIRLTGAAILLAVFEWGFRRTPINWRAHGLSLLLLALVGVSLVQYLFIFGVHYTSTLHASVIMSTMPIMTLCVSLALKKEAPNGLKISGALLAFAGVLWLISMRQAAAVQAVSYPWWGDALVGLNVCCFTLFLLRMPQMLQHYRPLTVIAYCYILAAILYIVMGVCGAYPIQWVPHLSPWGWCLAFYTVVFASIGTYGLNNYALARTKPSSVAIYAFMQPVLAATIGVVMLGEHVSLPMILASAVSLCGMSLANLGRVK
jgi:drug/metabolite transporter (DMT)-like permease